MGALGGVGNPHHRSLKGYRTCRGRPIFLVTEVSRLRRAKPLAASERAPFLFSRFSLGEQRKAGKGSGEDRGCVGRFGLRGF